VASGAWRRDSNKLEMDEFEAIRPDADSATGLYWTAVLILTLSTGLAGFGAALIILLGMPVIQIAGSLVALVIIAASAGTGKKAKVGQIVTILKGTLAGTAIGIGLMLLVSLPFMISSGRLFGAVTGTMAVGIATGVGLVLLVMPLMGVPTVPVGRDVAPITDPANVRAARRPGRLKKRVAIPILLLSVVIGLIAWAVVRGTWADRNTRDPKSPTDGIVTQLYEGPDGRTYVRCAIILDQPMTDVWSVVTDYEHYSEVFPHVCHTRIDRDPDGRYHLIGAARTPVFGDWPFEVHIRHEESSRVCSSLWDNPNQSLSVNRGGWTLTSLGPKTTLATYMLDVEIRPFPNFIIRNAFLSKLADIVDAVARAVEKRQHG
jgi:Polyketide cyclase / dehydrase and lipid transport